MLVEAGFVSLIRTLLIFAGIYYGFRILFRYLIPFLIRRFIQKQAGANAQNYQSNSSSRPGEVNIKTKPKSDSKTENLGDYVDYEEIKETE